MMFHAYPVVFPMDAALYLAPILRGKMPEDRNSALNAAYALQGYGMGQIFPLPEAVALAAAGAPSNWLDAACTLEMMCDSSQPKFTQGSLPWKKLLPVLFDVIIKLLELG